MATTSNEQRLIVTKGSNHVAKSTAPDVCKLPNGTPIAPDNFVKSDKLLKGATTHTFIAKQPIMTSIGELGPPSEPAHGGSAGGVRSGTYRAEAKATSYSADVILEGHPAVRVYDTTTQNHGNTSGLIIPELLFELMQALAGLDDDCLKVAAGDGTAFVK